YRGRNIADVLDLTVEEAVEFFEAHPKIHRMLACIRDVGLDYMQLGQASTTLSGGEAQRVKLASELGSRPTGHTLYILDEPTTGLHFDDVRKLLSVLQRLADAGNTLVVIEHNLEVIKCSDWLIDLGPEGGDRGGEIIATGTPEEVAGNTASHTGRWLKSVLKSAPATGRSGRRLQAGIASKTSTSADRPSPSAGKTRKKTSGSKTPATKKKAPARKSASAAAKTVAGKASSKVAKKKASKSKASPKKTAKSKTSSGKSSSKKSSTRPTASRSARK
ncbi:MAG: ATP-binding cassette domain-containing protein, partial [Phycisphaerales bacterium]|nr:ATP-binding cassette domain-containing protein [Phycisphaerales bacterium]